MTGFIFVTYQTKNKEALQEYAIQVPKTLKKFDGRMFIRGEKTRLNGEEEKSMQAVLSFPSAQHAEDWYYSEDYQLLVPLREQAMSAEFHLVG